MRKAIVGQSGKEEPMKITIAELADTVNKECDRFRYFWAAGIIKETVDLWRVEEHMNLLSETAQVMAKTYLEA